jgi:excisionase family DNA binding protein
MMNGWLALATTALAAASPAAPPGAPSAVAQTPTTMDLTVLYGGKDRLLRVAEVAEQLAVGAWAVYRFCEDGVLPHVRINNSIRVRPRDLEEFVAARRNADDDRRPRKRSRNGVTTYEWASSIVRDFGGPPLPSEDLVITKSAVTKATVSTSAAVLVFSVKRALWEQS